MRTPEFFTPPHETPSLKRLTQRYEYLLDLPISWQAHITGGKDSRAALAAILSSGRTDRIKSFRTNGSDENGDVIVAKQIASKVGLTTHISEGDKAAQSSEADLDRHYQRFAYAAWRYDGHLTAWDGTGSAAAKRPKTATLMGGGGEIYRQKGIHFPKNNFESCVERFMRWYFRFNQAGLVSSSFARSQASDMRRHIADEFFRGSVNLQPSPIHSAPPV